MRSLRTGKAPLQFFPETEKLLVPNRQIVLQIRPIAL
jgi:hypothetical protein